MTTSETARELLWRHGLPEDVLDGALALHAQELAASIREETLRLKAHGVLEPDKYRPCRDAANQIDPTRDENDPDETVLPAPEFELRGTAGIRAAALTEAADALERLDPVEAALAGQHAWRDAAALLRRMAVEEQQPDGQDDEVAAAVASCPGYETSPNPCRCPCYGCKHHCSAHNPDDPRCDMGVPPVGSAEPAHDHTETPRTVRCSRAILSRPHPAHGWYPQPGMDPVDCPGHSFAGDAS
jgi:hypothetical protein